MLWKMTFTIYIIFILHFLQPEAPHRLPAHRTVRTANCQPHQGHTRVSQMNPSGESRPNRKWLFTNARQRKRQALAAVLLLLAGGFSLRGWRAATMIQPIISSNNNDNTNNVGQSWTPGLTALTEDAHAGQCQWKDNGSVLYHVRHPRSNKDGEV